MKSILTTITVAMVTACGGGGSGDSGTKSGLSITQQNFETTTKADYYVTFDWYLPNTDMAPTNGTNFFNYGINLALTSPSAGPVLNTTSSINMTKTLKLPDATKRYVDRVLKSGVIYYTNDTSKQVWSYAGNDVLLTTYATDGQTKLYTSVYDDWSAPIPFSGTIGTTSILKSFYGFTRLNTPSNFDFTNYWYVGSSYFTRKGYQQADTLFVWDWTGVSYDANVTPYSGSESTIEALFSTNKYMNGIGVDNVLYKINEGTISTIEGTRTWVANVPRPTSASPTTGFVALFELNGKIYGGALRKAGARFNSVDGIDSTKINDYNIKLNSKAVESLKQTVKF